MVTPTLIGQTGVTRRVGPLPVHRQGPQVHLVVKQGLGIVTVGELDHDDLLVHGVEVVEAAVHHGDGGGLVDGRPLLQDCPSVGSVTVYRLNLIKQINY